MKQLKLFFEKRGVLSLLFIIVIVATFLRFYQLASNPPSLTWDETAWGYNAYSLGIDAKDEFGRFLPLTYLESFGDFKPPVYAYLTVIPVKIFGLTEFATRFASAFFGVLTVLLTYFLVKELLLRSELKKRQKETIALLSSLLLAISPWHILLSRAAFEQNVATFFVGLGVYLFLVSVHHKKWLLIGSVLSFLLAMNTFNTPRIIAPILLITLLLWNIRYLYKNMKKQVITAGIVGGILFIPLFLFLLTPQSKLRFQEVNIFSDSSIVLTANQEIANDHNAMWSKVIHNRRLGYAEDFLKHYFDNLNPSFLFITGDGNPKFSTQQTGEMYIWEIIFVVAGVFFLFKKREGDHWWFPVFWFLVAIIPAATARETPHALRIENGLPMPQFFTAYGLYYVVTGLKGRVFRLPIKKIAVAIIFLTALGNFLYFYHDYFTFYPSTYSGEWQYGYKDALTYVQKEQNKYTHIVMTEALGRPYIYSLFYEKYSPQAFRKNANITRDAFGFVDVHSFGKFVFLAVAANGKQQYKKSLFIDAPNDVPKNAHILKNFDLLNGNPSLVAYTVD